MNNRTNTRSRLPHRTLALAALLALIIVASMRLRADTGTCGGQSLTLPFTDVPGTSGFFCAIASAYFTGLTNGTNATEYRPAANVTREQMAAFVTRTLDQSLKRGSNRAALGQFWTIQTPNDFSLTTVGSFPKLVESDGADLWVANSGSNSVFRVRASDGKLLEKWTGATAATGVLVAKGKVFVTGDTSPGRLYQIDPTLPEGPVTTLSSTLPDFPTALAYDGRRIWIVAAGSVLIVRLNPLTVTPVTAGLSNPFGIVYDGANIWVTDNGDVTLKKLNSTGAVLQSINLTGSSFLTYPVFDGANVWVPTITNSLKVVRVKDSAGNPLPDAGPTAAFLLASLSGNGLNAPTHAAFDGERIMVTNNGGDSVSLWKAADLTPLGTVSTGTGTNPFGVCSDGLNFWITLNPSGSADKLARF
jgi:hypothetical protein